MLPKCHNINSRLVFRWYFRARNPEPPWSLLKQYYRTVWLQSAHEKIITSNTLLKHSAHKKNYENNKDNLSTIGTQKSCFFFCVSTFLLFFIGCRSIAHQHIGRILWQIYMLGMWLGVKCLLLIACYILQQAFSRKPLNKHTQVLAEQCWTMEFDSTGFFIFQLAHCTSAWQYVNMWV